MMPEDLSLLRDGDPYFMDAVITIAEIARRNQAIVHRVADRRYDDLLEALRFSKKEVTFSDFSSPDLQKAGPDMPVYVGVRLKVPKFQMQIYRFCSAGKQSGIG